jgi:hypothetical protein
MLIGSIHIQRKITRNPCNCCRLLYSSNVVHCFFPHSGCYSEWTLFGATIDKAPRTRLRVRKHPPLESFIQRRLLWNYFYLIKTYFSYSAITFFKFVLSFFSGRHGLTEFQRLASRGDSIVITSVDMFHAPVNASLTDATKQLRAIISKGKSPFPRSAPSTYYG